MDISYLLWLQGIREAAAPGVEQFFELVSLAAAPLALAISFALYWCVDKQRGMFVLESLALGSVVTQTVKNVVCCYRPWVRDARVHPSQQALSGATGYSFPSGHTTIAASTLGAVAWEWRKRTGVVIACVVGALLVGFSRNFLGVHTPQDVLVGIAVSVAAILVVNLVARWVEAGDAAGVSHRDVAVLVGGLALCLVAGAIVLLAPHPLDYDASGAVLVDPATMRVDAFTSLGFMSALLASWFAERRCVRFSTDAAACGRHEKLARVLVSLALTAVVFLVVIAPLKAAVTGPVVGAGDYVYHFLRGFLPVVCCVLAGPAIAKAAFGAR